jgi:putative membrane protein
MDGWRWFPMLIPALFWVGIIGLAVWAFAFRGGPTRRDPEPLDILRERYARGEIGREEYLERRRHLA